MVNAVTSKLVARSEGATSEGVATILTFVILQVYYFHFCNGIKQLFGTYKQVTITVGFDLFQ